MRSIFSSRRQSTHESTSKPTDLPLPPQAPSPSDEKGQNEKRDQMPRMEVFAAKLEETCKAMLAKFDSVTTWSLSVCTVDGKRVALGDQVENEEALFPLNELCYLLNYCLAAEELGEAQLKMYFASKPIPRDRDEFSLHPDGKAWNPLCRAGGLLLRYKDKVTTGDSLTFFVKFTPVSEQ